MLKIPDGTGIDLERVARYVRTAAYEERCAAGERLINCCDTVACSNEFSKVTSVLDAAKSRFESAAKQGDTYNLDTSRAEAGLEFTEMCLEKADHQVRLEEKTTKAEQLISDARIASINGNEDQAKEQYREAKTILESVLSASEDRTSPAAMAAKQLNARLEERLC